MKSVELKSGAKLEILNIPFAEAKSLYQAVLEEAKSVKFDSKQDMAAVIKDLFCSGFSSKRVDDALARCLLRCTYNGLKIDDKVFEDAKAREDYSMVCLEVLQDTLAPFTRGLYAELPRLLAMIPGSQK